MAWDGTWFGKWDGAWSGDTSSSSPGVIEVGRTYLARRIGFKDGKPLFKISTPCPNTDGTWDTGTVLSWRRFGFNTSKPVGKVMVVPCNTDGTLKNGIVYPAKRIGFSGGKPLFKAYCVPDCEESECPCANGCCGDITVGGTLDIPITLTATVDPGCMAPFTVVLSLHPSGGDGGDAGGGGHDCGCIGNSGNLGSNEGGTGLVRRYTGDFIDAGTGHGTLNMLYFCNGDPDVGLVGPPYRRCQVTLDQIWYIDDDDCIRHYWSGFIVCTERTGTEAWDATLLFDDLAGGRENASLVSCNPFDLEASGTIVCAATAPPINTGTTLTLHCVGSGWTIDITP